MSDAQPFLRLAFGLTFEDLHDPAGLARLDGCFADELRGADAALHERWAAARANPAGLEYKAEAEFLIAVALSPVIPIFPPWQTSHVPDMPT